MRFHAVFCLMFILAMNPLGLRAEMSAKSYMEEGNRLMQEEKYDDAVAAFQSAIQLAPKIPQIHNALGVAYLQMEGRFHDALAAFESALKIDPKNADAYFNIGLAYQEYQLDPISAKEYFQKAIDKNPRFIRAYYALGMIYLTEEQDPETALKYFDSSLKLNPNFSPSYFGLGISNILLGRPEKALKPITMLRQLNQDHLAMTLEAMMRGEGLFVKEETAASAEGENQAPTPPDGQDPVLF